MLLKFTVPSVQPAFTPIFPLETFCEHVNIYLEIFYRKSTEEILENHVRDLKLQLSKREEIIDKLRDDMKKLEREKDAVEQRVGGMIILFSIFSKFK